MMRCMELARLGLGNVAPNPMVGAVIVYEDKIIGEGYHKQFGKAHAEVGAVLSVKEPSLLARSTLYVNLEPCSHFGKTPPCADLIIEKKIPRVIIASADPNLLVKGNGIKKLKRAGCKIKSGVLEKQAIELNKRFFTFHQKKRPYLILKWAQSADKFIAQASSNLRWISNEYSRKLVHKWRSEEQAILVGTNTAMHDNPRLTVREWKGNHPIRMVIDRDLKLPRHLHLFDRTVPTVVFTAKKSASERNLQCIQLDFKKNVVEQITNWCYHNRIQSLIVEGGKKLLDSFTETSLWDEARIFTSRKMFNAGTPAPRIRGRITAEENMMGDQMVIIQPN